MNDTVRMTWIGSLHCPSDGSAGRSYFAGGWPPSVTGPGKSSYAACHHEVEAAIDEDNHGVFFLNSHIRVVDVTDGLSQTIFLGEVPSGSAAGWVSGTRATLRNTGHPINGVTPGSVVLIEPGSLPLGEALESARPGPKDRCGRPSGGSHIRGRVWQYASRRRSQFWVRRWIGAVYQADDRFHVLSAARSSVGRRDHR